MSTLDLIKAAGEKPCGTCKAEATAQAAAGPAEVATAERPAQPQQGDARAISICIEMPKPNGKTLYVLNDGPNGTASFSRAAHDLTLRGVDGSQRPQHGPLGAVKLAPAVSALRREFTGHAPLAAPNLPRTRHAFHGLSNRYPQMLKASSFPCPLHRTAAAPAMCFRFLQAKAP